jgi:hypothetical protein
MKIMFIKDYIDTTLDKPLLIEATTVGTLINEYTGRVYIDEIKVEIDGVDPACFAPLKGELSYKT